MARLPSHPHGGRDAHAVERAERNPRPSRATFPKDRVKVLKAASIACHLCAARIERLRRRSEIGLGGKWTDADSVDLRIEAGDAVADIDTLTEAVVTLTALRDKLARLRGIDPEASCSR